MQILTNKQIIFFNFLIKFYQENKDFPSLNDIKKITSYKSYNTIYKYLYILETKKFLVYDKQKKKIIFLNTNLTYNKIKLIPFINKNKYISIDNSYLNTNQYIAFIMPNNHLQKLGIFKNDILIIEKNTNYLNNKFVLINENNNYNVFKLIKKDGYIHLLNDKNLFFIENTSAVIGKVKLSIRNYF